MAGAGQGQFEFNSAFGAKAPSSQTGPFVFGSATSTVANLPTLSMAQSLQGTTVPSSQPFATYPPMSFPMGMGVLPTVAPTTGITLPQLSAASGVQPSAPPAPTSLSQAFAAPTATAAAGTQPALALAGAPAQAPVASVPPVQPSSNTMTYRQLEETVNQWNADLENNEQMFLEMATELNAWDRVLHESAKGIASVSDDLKDIRKEQDSLQADLDNLSTQHEEFERILEPLERHLLELRSSRQSGAGGGQRLAPSLNADAHERERLYDMCAELEQQSGQCAAQLRELEQGVRLVTAGAPAPTSAKGAPGPDAACAVVKVLNEQLGALESLERRCVEMSKRAEAQAVASPPSRFASHF